MQSIDTLNRFVPVRPMVLVDPPGDVTGPITLPEPICSPGQGLGMRAAICKCGDRFEVAPQAQGHCKLVQTHSVRSALRCDHRPPRMLPGLHVPDGPIEESRASFGGCINVAEAVD